MLSVFDAGTGPNLISADVLDPSWLHSVRQRDMLDSCSAYDAKLRVSGTITLHMGMSKSRTRVNFGVENELVVPILLGTPCTDRLFKSVHPVERTIFPHHSPPVPILMVHKAGSAGKNGIPGSREEVVDGLALLATPLGVTAQLLHSPDR